MDEMGLPATPILRTQVKGYRKFFNAKDRRAKVAAMSNRINTAAQLHTAVMSALAGLKQPSPNGIIRAVLSGSMDLEENAVYQSFVSYGAEKPFWVMVAQASGYKVNADVVYIFPNNKNIILAAEQATHLVEDKDIIVIPSKTVPQGITAIINFAPDLSPEENKESMIEEMSRVKTAQITYAVRNTTIDDKEIKEGDIMGIADKGIAAVGQDVEETALETLKTMLDDESELVTIYYGADVDEARAEEFQARVEELCEGCDVDLQFGGQPIYYYVVSVE